MNPEPRRVLDWLLRGLLAGVLLVAAGAVVWLSGDLRRGRLPAEAVPGDGTESTAPTLVGAARCAECHVSQAEDHALSGHSRTFHLTRDFPVAMSLCGQSVPASGDYGRFVYECDEAGLMVGLPDLFGERLFPLDFALGSGDHAVTFVSPQQDAEGETVGIEHRMTWYRARNGLGLTPSHESASPHADVEYFGKLHAPHVLDKCIDCHTTAFRMEGHHVVDLVAGVQCEECHGPGSAHVAAMDRGVDVPVDKRILMPQTAEEELRLCGRCHRLAEEIAPDRLERYPPSLVRFQPVGLSLSRCYIESEGRLRCTTCHSPHGPISAEEPTTHIAACRQCHDGQKSHQCAELHTDNCVSCHMRRSELIPGIFFHDHWIRARPPVPEIDREDGTSNVDVPCSP